MSCVEVAKKDFVSEKSREGLRQVVQNHRLLGGVACRKCGDDLDVDGYCVSNYCIDRRVASR